MRCRGSPTSGAGSIPLNPAMSTYSFLKRQKFNYYYTRDVDRIWIQIRSWIGEIHFGVIKSLEHLKIFLNSPVLYIGLKITIHVIKSQIHLVTREEVP
jgi:hypothetical protein